MATKPRVRRGYAGLTHHSPHKVEAIAELMGHLVAQHYYTAEALSGGSAAFLHALHDRGHQQMAGDPPRTVEQVSDSADRLFSAALDALETLIVLDRDHTRLLASRWVEALNMLVR